MPDSPPSCWMAPLSKRRHPAYNRPGFAACKPGRLLTASFAFGRLGKDRARPTGGNFPIWWVKRRSAQPPVPTTGRAAAPGAPARKKLSADRGGCTRAGKWRGREDVSRTFFFCRKHCGRRHCGPGRPPRGVRLGKKTDLSKNKQIVIFCASKSRRAFKTGTTLIDVILTK